MYLIYTAFDKSKSKPKILGSIIRDKDTNETYIWPMYIKGNSEKAYDTKQKEKFIRDIITSQQASINDFKSHITALQLPLEADYKISEIPIGDEIISREWSVLEGFMQQKLETMEQQANNSKWQNLIAEATLVYSALEKRGVIYDGNLEPMHPIYDVGTFTGRSRTSEFNIQGMGDDAPISPIRTDYNIMLCADWIAADMRMASLMSGDTIMQQSFITADPYVYLTEQMGIDRPDCKKQMLSSIYSLNTNSEVLNYFPEFRKWIDASKIKMHKDGYLSSVLGRPFKCDGDNDRAVFNATIQGSMAHAMQNSLIKLHKKYPQSILTELHDSIILCCNKNMLKSMIDDVATCMLHPFNGLLDHNPTFPVRILVGNKWRAWKEYQVYRI